MLGRLVLTVVVFGSWIGFTVVNLLAQSRSERRLLAAMPARGRTTPPMLWWEAAITLPHIGALCAIWLLGT